MKAIKLKCILMHNKEVMFNGRSLGFLKDEEVEKFTEDNKD